MNVDEPDEDFFDQVFQLPGEDGWEEPPVRSPPKSSKTASYVIDATGRPEPEEYLDGHLKLKKPTHKTIVGKLTKFFTSKLPAFANSVYVMDYHAAEAMYSGLKSQTGKIPEEYLNYTDLRSCANFVAVELLKAGKAEGIVFYSEEMDALIMELACKFGIYSDAAENGCCPEFSPFARVQLPISRNTILPKA